MVPSADSEEQAGGAGDSTARPQESGEAADEGGSSDEEAKFDAALDEAQKIIIAHQSAGGVKEGENCEAAEDGEARGSEGRVESKKRRRGGCKESQKRRKRLKKEVKEPAGAGDSTARPQESEEAADKGSSSDEEANFDYAALDEAQKIIIANQSAGGVKEPAGAGDSTARPQESEEAADKGSSSDEEANFDYAALDEAQQIIIANQSAGGVKEGENCEAAEGGEAHDSEGRVEPKKRQRGGCKESQKRRKRLKKEVKEAGSGKRRFVPSPGSKRSGSVGTPSPGGPLAEAVAGEGSQASAAQGETPKKPLRPAHVTAALNAQKVFVTNLCFKTTEQDIRDWLGEAGAVQEVTLGRDKVTARVLGYAHVKFQNAAMASAAVEKCDRQELHGRDVRVLRIGESWTLELPHEIQDDIRGLLREAYEGKNLSTVKDAWQKRHPGQKLDTTRWGFKNFSAAVATIEGIVLEHHLEKKLTNLAFFDGSPKHLAFLEEKQRAGNDSAGAGSAPLLAARRADQRTRPCWGCVIA